MNQLLTGADYIESLRDGRNVYLHGEKVDDVTHHPAFRNCALSISRMYDALHTSESSAILTAKDEFGTVTHKFFKPSRNAQELVEAREAIAYWQRMGYGFLGRTPEYKASFMAGLAVNADYYGPFAETAKSWYQEFTQKALYLNHVIINPPLNRKKPIHEMGNEFIRVIKETDGGIIVSGAKMLATGSAITHASFVAPVASAVLEPGRAEDFALVFFVRMNNPKLRLLCRQPFGTRAPFDQPLASRFDENDAVLILDNAFIPWEDVLVYRDIERSTQFYAKSGFPNLYNFQSGIRLAIKLEFMTGLLSRCVRANGTDQFRGVQAAVGEMISMRNMVWALTSAMAYDTEPSTGGTVVPKLDHATAVRMVNAQVWARVQELFGTNLGGAPIVVPSSHQDMKNEELRSLIDQYYRGADCAAWERIQLLKLAWDAMGTEFAGRDQLYERNYSGNADQVRLDAVRWARRSGALARFEGFVQDCLDDYDINGWVRGPWRNQSE